MHSPSRNARSRLVSSGSTGIFCFSCVRPRIKIIARPDSRKSTYAMESRLTTLFRTRMNRAISATQPESATQQRGEITELFLHQLQGGSGQLLNGEPRAAGHYGHGHGLVLPEQNPRQPGPGQGSGGDDQVMLLGKLSNHVFEFREIDRYHVSSLGRSPEASQYNDC